MSPGIKTLFPKAPGTTLATIVQEESGTAKIGQTIQKGVKGATTGAQVATTAQTIGKAGNAAIKAEQVAQEGSTISGSTKIGETGTIVEGQLTPLGRGCTGRSEPSNLHEQLAMREIMSDPSQGTKIGITMTDPRWLEKDGWYKMAWYSKELDKDIHYVVQKIDGVIVAIDDFKFIDK